MNAKKLLTPQVRLTQNQPDVYHGCEISLECGSIFNDQMLPHRRSKNLIYLPDVINLSNPGKRLFNSARRTEVMHLVPSISVWISPAARSTSK